MAKHKKNQKPTTKKQSSINMLKSHKLITALVLILLVIIMTIPYNKYKDWDNAQLIKGLAKDFPLLVSDIEAATGLDLEQKVDCSITQEKYASGVKTCELSIAKKAPQETVDKGIKTVNDSMLISSTYLVENGRGFEIGYRNKKSCTLSNRDTIYLTCITAVREANIELAKELFQNY